jgi:tetratricopeptide (TPR) repeat protein
MIPNRFYILLFLSQIIIQFYLLANKNILKKKLVKSIKSGDVLMKGKLWKSLIQGRLALKYAIAADNDNLIAIAYNTIGANFDELSSMTKPLLLQKRTSVCEKTNNHQLKKLALQQPQEYLLFWQRIWKGITYYKKSLEYSSKVRDSAEIVFTKLNITWACFDIGQFDAGLPYLKFVNQFHPKFGDDSTIALNMLRYVP